MSDNLPAKRPTIKDIIMARKDDIREIIPAHISIDRFLKTAVMATKNNDNIKNCSLETKIGSIVECATLGLEPGTGTGEAYLVPFKSICTLIIGYRGLMKLARQSGEIRNIFARIVYENEVFINKYGNKPVLEHTPAPPSERGNKIGVYAVAIFKDGSESWEYLWGEEVENIKKISRSSSHYSSPWQNFPEEMWKKTAIRRLAKFLPLSIEKHNNVLQRAVTIDEMGEANILQPNPVFSDFAPDDVYEADVTVGNKEQIEAPVEVKDPEPTKVDKPKKTRRTNAQMEADKKKKDDEKAKSELDKKQKEEAEMNALMKQREEENKKDADKIIDESKNLETESENQQELITPDPPENKGTKISPLEIPVRTFVCAGCGSILSSESPEFDMKFDLYRIDKETIEAHCLNPECGKITEAKV